MNSDRNDFERTPMLTLHPPLTGAAFAGQLESVKVLLDEVKVSIDEYDENGPSMATPQPQAMQKLSSSCYPGVLQ